MYPYEQKLSQKKEGPIFFFRDLVLQIYFWSWPNLDLEDKLLFLCLLLNSMCGTVLMIVIH